MQSLKTRFEQQGILKDVLQYIKIHGKVKASVFYNCDLIAFTKFCEEVGGKNFGENPLIPSSAGNDPFTKLADALYNKISAVEAENERLKEENIQLRQRLEDGHREDQLKITPAYHKLAELCTDN